MPWIFKFDAIVRCYLTVIDIALAINFYLARNIN